MWTQFKNEKIFPCPGGGRPPPDFASGGLASWSPLGLAIHTRRTTLEELPPPFSVWVNLKKGTSKKGTASPEVRKDFS